MRSGWIRAQINSKGDDWPDEEIAAIKEFFEGRGYIDTASGSGGNQGDPRWWAVQYEKKVEEEK